MIRSTNGSRAGSGGGGGGLSESTWDALPASGLINGSERIVTALGPTSERALVRVVAGHHQLVVPTSTVQAYATAHPIPGPSPAQVTGLVGLAGSGQVALSWASAQYASMYKVYRKIGAAAEGLLTTVVATSFTDTGLTNGVQNQYRIVGTNAVGDGITSATITATPNSRITHKRDILLAQFGNALLQDIGVPPVEGVIPAGGRTFSGHFERQVASAVSNYRVYGIRAALVNQRQSPISGGRMIVGCRTAWRGDYLPDAGGEAINVLSENPLAGWASMKIGGSPLLPIPAASASQPMVTWTDWLVIPGGFVWNTGGMMWRFFHPGQAVATDYTLTIATWSENEWERRGTAYDANRLYNKGHNDAGEFAWQAAYFYTEGNGVAAPETKGFADFSANKSPDGAGGYGPPGPGSYPFIQIQLSMEPM